MKVEASIMWRRFTERARRVVFCSQKEAERLGHREFDTQHHLHDDAKRAAEEDVWPPAPSVWRGKDSVAIRVLKEMKIDLGVLRAQAEQQSLPGSDTLNKDMELTAASKRVIDLTYKEAQRLKNNYIGTEHLLLGLIAEEQGIAGQFFVLHGVSLEGTRRAVTRLQNGEASQEQVAPLRISWWASLLGPKRSS
jgi:ATP-dependent Clp protease ATP-binding subunit ClpC